MELNELSNIAVSQWVEDEWQQIVNDGRERDTATVWKVIEALVSAGLVQSSDDTKAYAIAGNAIDLPDLKRRNPFKTY